MMDLSKDHVTVYRFSCLKCHTSLEVLMPFRRKPCPLCGNTMNLVAVITRFKDGEKGGEKP